MQLSQVHTDPDSSLFVYQYIFIHSYILRFFICPDRESNPGHRNHNAEYSPLYDLDQQNDKKFAYIIT